MKHSSLTSVILWVMLVLIVLSSTMAIFAIANLIYSLGDAKAINASGLLRTQSYQLLYNADSANKNNKNLTIINNLEKTLYSKELQTPISWLVPTKLKTQYKLVRDKWLIMKKDIETQNNQNYLVSLKNFTNSIDLLIKELEKHAFFKLKVLVISQIIGLGIMLLIAWFAVKCTQEKVVLPLSQMVESANNISKGKFDINIPQSDSVELASLGTALYRTAKELSVLYKNLELQVKEKTLALTKAHNELSFLHQSLLILHTQPVNQYILKNVLINLQAYQSLEFVRLVIQREEGDTKIVETNKPWPVNNEAKSIQFELKFEMNHLGYLEVITHHSLNHALFENFTMMLARSIIIRHSRQQTQKLALMEERGIIARELHDSLGQLLSFLKIQISLLKKAITQNNNEQQINTLIEGIKTGVNDSYQQLRQLLSTFRLTIKEPNLQIALQAMLEQLKAQTNIDIKLDYQLPTKLLQANQHIHILQLTREATLNAIKHAKASEIHICCKTLNNGMLQVDIRDDGIGLAHIREKQQHFGIGIMHERANKLAGIVEFNSNAEGGTTVSLSFPPLEIS